VNRLTSVTTEPIDINGLTQTFEQTAVLDLPEGLSVDPEQIVTVRIEVEPILTTSTFIRVPERRGLRSGFEATVEPTQVRVVVFGPLPVLDALAESDVRVILDLFGLEEGTYSIEPDVIVPDRGIEVRSVQPTAVSVTIAEIEARVPGTPVAVGTRPSGSAIIQVATPVRYTATRPAICDVTPVGALIVLPSICLQGQETQ
jgi:YbbR domain-containing protein